MYTFQTIRCRWGNSQLVRVIFACFAVHFTSLLVGLSQGYSATLIPQLVKTNTVDNSTASWIASLGVISNPIGAVIAGASSEWLGRRTTIQVSSIPYFLGWFVIFQAQNNYWLCIGRFTTGLAVGMISVTYTYIVEVTPPEHRGILAACGPVVTSFGVLVSYILGIFFHWKIVALFCVLISIVVLLVMQLLPESPVWLVSQKRITEAGSALKWLRANNEIETQNELDILKRRYDSSPQLSIIYSDGKDDKFLKCDKLDDGLYFFKPECYKPFLILLFFFFFQELSGIYVILFYSVDFFASMDTVIDEYVSTICVGLVRFLASILGAYLIHKSGRKNLACISGAGMFIFLISGTLYTKFYETHSVACRSVFLAWVPFVSILCTVIASMLGFLQLPYVMNSELFPLKYRGIMSGIVLAIANIFIFVSVKLFPGALELLGMSGLLFTFSMAAFMGAIFCFKFLPDTKNMTLEEIESYFKGQVKLIPSNKSKSTILYPASPY